MLNLKDVNGNLTDLALDQGFTQNNGKGLQLIKENNAFIVINAGNWKHFKTLTKAQAFYHTLNK